MNTNYFQHHVSVINNIQRNAGNSPGNKRIKQLFVLPVRLDEYNQNDTEDDVETPIIPESPTSVAQAPT